MTDEGGKSGLVLSLSEKLIRVLPPAFILLVLLNILFMAAATWTFSHNADQRNALLTRIVENCLLAKAP